MDIGESQISKLKKLFPEVFTEGNKIDWEKLKLTLGSDIDFSKERFGLNWNGKVDCYKTIQQQSIATLIPSKEESIDFDTTENIFIEADNLEALKLLQKSYLGKIKTIYIDPPYNTGGDFIYPDNYSENLETYLQFTGQSDNSGRKLSTNLETDGRFHSKWLNMMYPRLFLAKNLLREDGVIFISIDENEVYNLRALCNEIFGEENFRNNFVVRRYDKNLNRQFIEQGLKTFNVGFEYILCYSKSQDFNFNPVYKESSEERQNNGYWKGFWNDADRPTMRYDILGFTPEAGQWKWKKETAHEAVKNYQVFLEKFSNKMTLEEYWISEGKKLKFIRRNPTGQGKNKGVENWIPPASGILRNTNWTDLFASKNEPESQNLFDFPKNKDLIKLLIQSSCNGEDMVLDFFAGSATTAHAILELNLEETRNLKFICIQLPYPTDESSEEFKLGYKTIADVSKERIRRVIKKITSGNDKEKELFQNDISQLDLGFKVFKLSSSNFKVWDSSITKQPEVIQTALEVHTEHINPKATQDAILYELLIKSGFQLTTHIEEITLEGKIVYSVAEGELLICLEDELTLGVLKSIGECKPSRVVCLDKAFKGANADALKTNAVQIMKSKGVVNFRTV